MTRLAGSGCAVLRRYRFRPLLALLLVLSPLAGGLSPPVSTAAPQAAGGTSLAGVVVARAVFDINRPRPEGVLEALELVARSRKTIRDQGATPDFRVILRGPAARLVGGRSSLSGAEDRRQNAVAEKIRLLSGRGVRFAIDSQIARLVEADGGKLPSQLVPVDNVLVTLIALQNKGYALVPLY